MLLWNMEHLRTGLGEMGPLAPATITDRRNISAGHPGFWEISRAFFKVATTFAAKLSRGVSVNGCTNGDTTRCDKKLASNCAVAFLSPCPSPKNAAVKDETPFFICIHAYKNC